MVARYRILFVIAALVASLALVGAVVGQEGDSAGRDQEFEQEVLARLEAINPEAVPLFIQATADMDAGDYESARTGYEAVLALAPDFPDAVRRLSYVLVYFGDVREGLALARRALELEDTAYNELALAGALLAFDTGDSRAEALRVATTAADRLPDHFGAQIVLASAALENDDAALLRRASDAALRLEPENPIGHYYASAAAGGEGLWIEAERELLKAEELGFPSEEVQRILDAGVAAEARDARRNANLIQWGTIIVVGWVGGLTLLFLLGAILSRLTMANLKRKRGRDPLQASGFERSLRAVYRGVIVLASAYYYVSMPVLILIVVVVFGGAAYSLLAAGRIPLRLLFFVGAAGLATLFAIVQAIFVRAKESEPGRELVRQEAPELWQLAEQVAEKVGTRPVDHIYIVPGPEIAVTERGGILDKLRDRGRRLLIVGLAVLDGMTDSQFRAILAHEYGHFSGRDTAGGEVAYTAQVSMQQMAMNLADSGQARFYNPAWLFLNGYYRLFLRVTRGASRLQEILADRVAATAYGCENLLSGLEHVIRRSMEFDYQSKHEAVTSRQEKRAINNLYALPPPPEEAREEIDRQFKLELERSSSPYDSHPSFRERADCLEALGLASQQEVAGLPVAKFIKPIDQLQEEMTQVVQKYVAPYGW